MYIFTYMYTHKFTHIYTHEFTHTHTYTHMDYIYTYEFTCTHMNLLILMHVHEISFLAVVVCLHDMYIQHVFI